jgi:CBS domain-containing protein
VTHHLNDPIATLAHRDPVAVTADATLRDVAHRLWAESVGALVVDHLGHPRGVISERDIVTALARGADPDTATAGDAMTPQVISARLQDPILDAVFQMLDGAIRHLPIVDDDGAVIAMVSVRDMLGPLLLDALGG